MDSLRSPAIGVTCTLLDTMEDIRKATQNRVTIMTHDAALNAGWGLPRDHPAVVFIDEKFTALQELENQVTRRLEKLVKAHPLGPWIEAQRGIGLKQGGRLLAATGDPYWRDETETLEAGPRTVRQLWAYCGLHLDDDGFSIRRQKGQKSNWNATSKMRIYNVAAQTVKMLRAPCVVLEGDRHVTHGEDCTCGPWRQMYDQRRWHTLERTHARPCVRCGPSGNPAAVGSPWSDAHKHADAIRVVGKGILKGLWVQARELHKAD